MPPELEEKLSELEILRQALEESKAKAAEYYDQLLRLKAEFDNFRKRVDREKSESRAWGKQEVLLQLVSLVDVFEQALAQAHKAKDLKHVVAGVEAVQPVVYGDRQFSQQSADWVQEEQLPVRAAGDV